METWKGKFLEMPLLNGGIRGMEWIYGIWIYGKFHILNGGKYGYFEEFFWTKFFIMETFLFSFGTFQAPMEQCEQFVELFFLRGKSKEYRPKSFQTYLRFIRIHFLMKIIDLERSKHLWNNVNNLWNFFSFVENRGNIV